MEAIVTGNPFRVHGNVLNAGLIPNLPADAVVEVPCLVDKNGVQGCYAGPLPTQCAALNMTNINVQLLAVEAALKRSRDLVYQAAYLDPRCAAELTLDRIHCVLQMGMYRGNGPAARRPPVAEPVSVREFLSLCTRGPTSFRACRHWKGWRPGRRRGNPDR